MPTDCYEYVRNSYGVPAYVGVRVRLVGTRLGQSPREGVLVAAKSNLHYVHVRLDGLKHAVPAHPTDVEYLISRLRVVEQPQSVGAVDPQVGDSSK